MLKRCRVCNRTYTQPTSKGINMIPEICGGACFVFHLTKFLSGRGYMEECELKSSKRHSGAQKNILIPSKIQWILEPQYDASYGECISFGNDKRYEYRSTYEEDFGCWLTHNVVNIFNWWYEPLLFDNEYIPDFMLTDNFLHHVLFVEIKGLWQPQAYAKVKRFKEYCKEIKAGFYIIDKSTLQRINKP